MHVMGTAHVFDVHVRKANEPFLWKKNQNICDNLCKIFHFSLNIVYFFVNSSRTMIKSMYLEVCNLNPSKGKHRPKLSRLVYIPIHLLVKFTTVTQVLS